MKCKICGRVVTEKLLTASKMDDKKLVVYHESFGAACLKHEGVQEHFEKLVDGGDRLGQLKKGMKKLEVRRGNKKR